MAKKALIVKCQKMHRYAIEKLKKGQEIDKATRLYNRCKLCGRNRGYMRKFGICRICFRSLAGKGLITGLTKSSW